MKALSQEAAKRLALAHGAKLEVGGRAVNSARLQVVGAKPQDKSADMPNKPEPTPTPTIEPSKPDPALREAISAIDNFASSQFLLNDQNVQTMNAIKDMLKSASAQSPEKRPTQWVFKVKRDAQGLMETITATAKE